MPSSTIRNATMTMMIITRLLIMIIINIIVSINHKNILKRKA